MVYISVPAYPDGPGKESIKQALLCCLDTVWVEDDLQTLSAQTRDTDIGGMFRGRGRQIHGIQRRISSCCVRWSDLSQRAWRTLGNTCLQPTAHSEFGQ